MRGNRFIKIAALLLTLRTCYLSLSHCAGQIQLTIGVLVQYSVVHAQEEYTDQLLSKYLVKKDRGTGGLSPSFTNFRGLQPPGSYASLATSVPCTVVVVVGIHVMQTPYNRSSKVGRGNSGHSKFKQLLSHRNKTNDSGKALLQYLHYSATLYLSNERSNLPSFP